jgi:hypothetical protein
MNGISLPSEGLFNHACRLRLGFNEAEGSVARKSKVGRFCLFLQEPLVEIRSPIHTTSGRISVSVCDAETI